MTKRRLVFWLGYVAGALVTVGIVRTEQDLEGLEKYIARTRATWTEGWQSWALTITMFAVALACIILVDRPGE